MASVSLGYGLFQLTVSLLPAKFVKVRPALAPSVFTAPSRGSWQAGGPRPDLVAVHLQIISLIAGSKYHHEVVIHAY